MLGKIQSLHLGGLVIAMSLAGANVHASGIERLIYNRSGQRLNLAQAKAAKKEDLISLSPRLLTGGCNSSSKSRCIRWKIHGNNADINKNYVNGALQIWQAQASLDLGFEYAGVYTGNPVPESLGTGDFVFSFSPPSSAGLGNGVYSKGIQNISPQLSSKEALIQSSIIYLDPSLVGNKDISLSAVLLHEIGRLLGLARTDLISSVMFPIYQPAALTKLGMHEIEWASFLYPAANFKNEIGQLSGDALLGADGTPWVGAQIELIPKEAMKAFAEERDMSAVAIATSSDVDGKFKFSALPPGEYYVMVQPLSQLPFSFSFLGDWLSVFGDASSDLRAEFYDGAGREKNLEEDFAFATRLIEYGALVKVEAQRETTGVSIISNVADRKLKLIQAAGSSNETLSEFQAVRSNVLEKDANAMAGMGADGGCRLRPQQPMEKSKMLVAAMLLLAAFALLFSMRNSQRDSNF